MRRTILSICGNELGCNVCTAFEIYFRCSLIYLMLSIGMYVVDRLPNALRSVAVPPTAKNPASIRQLPGKLNHEYRFSTSKVSSTNDETYGNRLVYSPYVSPSHVIAEHKAAKCRLSPLFQHNIALTKSSLISKPIIARDDKRINLLA